MTLNQQRFFKILTTPSSITDEELEALQQITKKHPYFQLGHSLIAKAQHDRQAAEASKSLHLAAIYAPSRLCLKQLIEGMPTADAVIAQETGEADVSTPFQENEHANDASENPDTSATPDQSHDENIYRTLEENLQNIRANRDRLDEEAAQQHPRPPAGDTNATEDESYPYLANYLTSPTPPVEPSSDQQKNQMELIDKFINSDRDIRIRWRYQEGDPQDLSEKNTAAGGLVTENLAEIYVKQQRKDKAIEIYKKLILKYPDKKTYFAEKIESLKEN